jgi:hypothetical protein
MADINGVKFTSTAGEPTVYHTVTYTKSRPSNSTMQYVFTIKTNLRYSGSWIGTGYGLIGKITVAGTSAEKTIKSTSSHWSGTGDHTVQITITCPSTTGSATQSVKFEVIGVGGLTAGTMSNSSYTVTSSPLLYTRCTAPTSVSISPLNFEDNVTITWSGASGGTNNAIAGYDIRVYLANETNTGWVYDTYYNCNGTKNVATHITSNSSSGSGSYNFSWIPRGRHTKVNIATIGTQNGYWSNSGGDSNTVVRIPYTVCASPTSFTITPDDTSKDGFNTILTLSWSGANGGTNNAINGYLIQYCLSSDGSAWGGWVDFQTISSTKTYGNLQKDISSIVSRGYYIQFRIRTQGTAGSSYYSKYKNSATARRNPYTRCTAPTSVTLQSAKDVNNIQHSDIFNNQVVISWSGAKAGENNDIKRYYIEYCTSSNNSTWSNWDILQSSDLTPKGTTSTTVDVSSIINRGMYMKIHIRTEGVKMDRGANGGYIYYSDFIESSSIRRNSIPNAPTTFTISSHPTLEFSKGEAIKLQWDKPIDIDDNIFRYRIQYAIGNKNDVSNDIINSSWSNLATIDNKNTLEWTISATNSLFEQMENSQFDNSKSLIQFRLQVVDVFQEYNNGSNSYYTYSPIVTRYDMTGVAIGINGKWVNCQLFVGKNGNWIEQEVSAGINNAWANAGL